MTINERPFNSDRMDLTTLFKSTVHLPVVEENQSISVLQFSLLEVRSHHYRLHELIRLSLLSLLRIPVLHQLHCCISICHSLPFPLSQHLVRNLGGTDSQSSIRYTNEPKNVCPHENSHQLIENSLQSDLNRNSVRNLVFSS